MRAGRLLTCRLALDRDMSGWPVTGRTTIGFRGGGNSSATGIGECLSGGTSTVGAISTVGVISIGGILTVGVILIGGILTVTGATANISAGSFFLMPANGGHSKLERPPFFCTFDGGWFAPYALLPVAVTGLLWQVGRVDEYENQSIGKREFNQVAALAAGLRRWGGPGMDCCLSPWDRC